jgi:CRISPR-associated protein Cmr1
MLGGANGRAPELRTPSIKAALRFWWRAMHGHLSLKEIHHLEGKIFGGTDEKHGRSKVIIQLKEIDDIAPVSVKVLPHKDRSFSNLAFPVGKTFSIRLAMRGAIRLGKNKEFTLDHLKSLFIICATLGALGKRSRRGFGAYTITHIEEDKLLMPSTLEEVKGLLQKFSSHFQIKNNKIVFQVTGRSAAYPFIQQIALGKTTDYQDRLIRQISQLTHDLKTKDARDKKYSYEPSLGHAFRGRFASPVYVSLIGNTQKCRTIISSLNTVPDKNKHKISLGLQDVFRNSILK